MRRINRLHGNNLADESQVKNELNQTPLKRAIVKNESDQVKNILSKYYKWKSLKVHDPDINDFDDPKKYFMNVIESSDLEIFNLFLELEPDIDHYLIEQFMYRCSRDCLEKFDAFKKYLNDESRFTPKVMEENFRHYAEQEKYKRFNLTYFKDKMGPVVVNSNTINDLLGSDKMTCSEKLLSLKFFDDNFKTNYDNVSLNHSICSNVMGYLLTKPQMLSKLKDRDSRGQTPLFNARHNEIFYRENKTGFRYGNFGEIYEEKELESFLSVKILESHGAECPDNYNGRKPENAIVNSGSVMYEFEGYPHN
ncbi:hypothetical protein H012_gp897 [Acanthamoeba polyphaga moumouvirus]|uniref:Uncharacterized protein n=1 Tax=Acanthamoeba polyphaga moumouvirus TaxID=1269028 RepID=L7RB02_9VIRU|nr:hypothetical protein H012_gp897 [Acanthamoeba polyphaga moumouvirus]AGC01569.1 hypothetical protein Moumou_00021 [Acanthamoeba polyphaga moumouvirus]AQN67894.1 hypothetical protein [Saudi moumouvirus]